MAKKIKETPILRGKDAIKFMEQMKKAETEKINPKTRERVRKNYEWLKSIATFT